MTRLIPGEPFHFVCQVCFFYINNINTGEFSADNYCYSCGHMVCCVLIVVNLVLTCSGRIEPSTEL